MAFRISVSQIKTFNGSKAKRAGQKILGIQDRFDNDAFPLGHLFEDRLMTGKDNWDGIKDKPIGNMTKFKEQYETLKFNSEGLDFKRGKAQEVVKGKILGADILGYIDNYTDEYIDDIKTTQYLTNPEATNTNHRSGWTSYQEYELQLWIYMKIKNRKKARIIEVSKHKYKDDRRAHQILEFELTEDFDKKMTDRIQPIVKEMEDIWNKYKNEAR